MDPRDSLHAVTPFTVSFRSSKRKLRWKVPQTDKISEGSEVYKRRGSLRGDPFHLLSKLLRTLQLTDTTTIHQAQAPKYISLQLIVNMAPCGCASCSCNSCADCACCVSIP
jgi:hypothetical protein